MKEVTTVAEYFYTVEEVAARYRLSKRTILRYVDSGQLTCLRLGGVLRFTQSDLDAFEEQGRKRKEVSA